MDTERTAMQIFVEEFEREIEGQSDRGLVVVGTSGLDFAMESLLQAVFNDQVPRDQMYGVTGPLHELGGRIKIAAALGLITSRERKELDQIKKIRNKAAHQIGVNLSAAPLRDWCMNLMLGAELYVPREIPLVEQSDGSKGIPPNFSDPECDLPVIDLELPDASDPRARFTASVRVLLRILAARTTDAPMRRSVPSDFERPEDSMQLTLANTARDIREYETTLDEFRRLRDQLQEHGSSVEEEDQDIAELEVLVQKLKLMQTFYEYSNEVIRRSRPSK